MCRTERLTVLALTTARRYRIVTITVTVVSFILFLVQRITARHCVLVCQCRTAWSVTDVSRFYLRPIHSATEPLQRYSVGRRLVG